MQKLNAMLIPLIRKAGDLGINMSSTPVAAPTPALDLVGDLTPIVSSRAYYYDSQGQAIYYGFNTLNNVIVDPNTPQVGRADAINGGSGNDRLRRRIRAAIISNRKAANDEIVYAWRDAA